MNRIAINHARLASLMLGGVTLASAGAETLTVSIDANASGTPISRNLMGIFFEDLSYAADGGLYAEQVQNRSFDYGAADHVGWHPLTGWELVERGGGRGVLITDSSDPLHANNPRYAVLGVKDGGTGVGLSNTGFDGISVRAGERYDFSVFARQLSNANGPLAVRLESVEGDLLANVDLPELTGGWNRYAAVLEASRDDTDARLVLTARHPGRIGLDMVSLSPQETFQHRPHGLRADLAQAIAGLQPRFVRFPGGCLVHGDGIDNLYNWIDTIGPVEQRKGQRNIWRYHQSVGLGYFEYFQFCEDLGAEPVPVVPAGVSCQNSGASISGTWGQGQQGIPMEDMPAYVQDVLDLIEWANGPPTSEWGAKRAAAGHPEPFALKYLGVGNEDKITPVFAERFQMIYEAIRDMHPEITVIGTVGPAPSGVDYDRGWAIADELQVPMVDEHYYKSPQWFWDNLQRYDTYDRGKSKVYVGEWAAHDHQRRRTLRSAIAEAAFWTGLERNGDVVAMASYAPLLAHQDHSHWHPNLIYFSNTEVFPTIGYQVQKLLGQNAGDVYLPTQIRDAKGKVAGSTVRDSRSGDMILKLVNGENEVKGLRIELKGFQGSASAVKTVLAGDDPDAVNSDGSDPSDDVLPVVETLQVEHAFTLNAPAYSLTILRIPTH